MSSDVLKMEKIDSSAVLRYGHWLFKNLKTILVDLAELDGYSECIGSW